MSARHKFFDLGQTHQDAALDIIRSFLGIALFIRGVLFISDASRIIELVRAEQLGYLLPALALQVTALLHLAGGLMLATGLVTRLGALIQLPVLLVATYVVTIQGGLFLPNQSSELTILVLFLLVVLAVFGSGPFSLDAVLFREKEELAPVPLDQSAHRIRDRERNERIAVEAEQAALAGTVDPPVARTSSSGLQAGADNIWRFKMLVKFGGVIVIGAVLLVLLLRALPFEVSVGELAAVAGALFLILGFFLAFFSWALKD